MMFFRVSLGIVRCSPKLANDFRTKFFRTSTSELIIGRVQCTIKTMDVSLTILFRRSVLGRVQLLYFKI